MGDSRGRWDGDTLVVETTNFNGRTGSYWRNGDGNPTSEALRLVERFRLGDPQTLQYEVRVEDPETWTQPWTVAFSLPRDDDYVIYEYACHEGKLRDEQHPARGSCDGTSGYARPLTPEISWIDSMELRTSPLLEYSTASLSVSTQVSFGFRGEAPHHYRRLAAGDPRHQVDLAAW